MTIKTTKFAAILAGALALAAPLAMSAPAAAAPSHNNAMMRHDNNTGSGHMDAFHDRNHRPPMRAERRPHQPKGHYRWRTGAWNWRGGQWAWTPGIWIRF